jgi:hypothetical protein
MWYLRPRDDCYSRGPGLAQHGALLCYYLLPGGTMKKAIKVKASKAKGKQIPFAKKSAPKKK